MHPPLVKEYILSWPALKQPPLDWRFKLTEGLLELGNG